MLSETVTIEEGITHDINNHNDITISPVDAPPLLSWLAGAHVVGATSRQQGKSTYILLFIIVRGGVWDSISEVISYNPSLTEMRGFLLI